MSKKYQLVDPETPGPARAKTLPVTDWSICVLCQCTTPETLQCPATSNRHDVGAGYCTLAKNLSRFDELHDLPIPIDLSRLDDGKGIETTLMDRQAKWHKSCRTKFNSSKLDRAERRSALKQQEGDTESAVSKKFTRGQHTAATPDVCFFCEDVTPEPLREVATFQLNARVTKCASILQDERLLAKLSTKDMIAQEAKYHAKCLLSLYRTAAAVEEPKDESSNTEKVIRGIALAELVTYMDEARMDEDAAPIFKLANLVKLYSTRLDQLGVKQDNRPHSTELKKRILAHFPDLTAHKEGRDVLLVFDKDLGGALRRACKEDYDDEALCLARAAKIVRRDTFKMQATFTGSFDEDCQRKSVPQSLLTMVEMILRGPSINSESSDGGHQAALSLAQLLQYNSTVRRRVESSSVHHNKARETPLPIYVGLMVHARTRKRELVETLFDLGLSVSYDRVMEISTTMTNRVCEQYNRDQVVCPLNLRLGLFTTAAVDNIDHNPSSTTSTDSFHGTGISLFQYPTSQSPGTDRREHRVWEGTGQTRTLSQLPEAYTTVHPLVLVKKEIIVPKVDGPVKSDSQTVHRALQEETRWLETVNESSLQDMNRDSNISWAAYHASQQPISHTFPAITSLLPLFPDDSKSTAMIRHAMDVIKQAVQQLNPEQVPVITLDQPLYAIAKQIQWVWSASHGEDKFIIILGGLHIEMAGLKLLGNWLEDSGWVEALVQARVASSGTADSFLNASHVTRTRHAHQVTASSLHILLKKAYAQYEESLEPEIQAQPFDAWCEQKQEIPQFRFWYTTLNLELLILAYVRSLRVADFVLYTDCLTKLAPWFFSLDHPNYARWLPIHIRDMANLSKSHPDVATEFMKGNFTVCKTNRAFSCMALDQAHEQNNAAVKGDGGAVGLTQSPEGLRRWMVAGPELVRMTCEFEASLGSKDKRSSETRHHEQTKSAQVTFAHHVSRLVEAIEEMGNPFVEESNDLLKLDTRDIVDSAVVASIRRAEGLGQQQYEAYVTERLVERSTSISEPIKKNKLPLFSCPHEREKSKASLKISSLKDDCSLFSRLYIACQSRDGNLQDFFRHENQACPPSLSQLGKLRPGTKADLMECLETCTEARHDSPDIDVIILDGAVVVNILKPVAAKTFEDYALKVFLPYIERQLQHASRVDVVWDEYRENSLKSQARVQRGKGIRRRVDGQTYLPGNWQQFLRSDVNKTELFTFLSKHLTHIETRKQVITTHGENVMCNLPRDTSQLSPCNHEEADTRMMVHVADAVNHGHKKVLLRTVDTDVVVLAVASVIRIGVQELWVAFGTGQRYRYIPVHEIAATLGPAKSRALPLFHAFTGCDTVSAFASRGKKTAWHTWKVHDVTTTFLTLSMEPASLNDDHVAVLERFTILLYDRTSNVMNIDEARQELFTKKGRVMEAIPPTRAALIEHIKRAVYQGGHCWGKATEAALELPSPAQWGWTDPPNWKPLWTTLPEASASSRELIRCGCKKGCKGRCTCKKAALNCTALCQCGGKDCDL